LRRHAPSQDQSEAGSLRGGLLRPLGVFWRRLIGSKINILLVFLPIGLASGLAKWGAGPTFFLNFV
jgi:hypothetical protein